MEKLPNRYRLELGDAVRVESGRVGEIVTVFGTAHSAMERRAWDSTLAQEFWQELQTQRADAARVVEECHAALQSRWRDEPLEVHAQDPRARFRG